MVQVKTDLTLHKTIGRLQKYKRMDIRRILESCGHEGVAALAQATPTDTGMTANSWTYEIKSSGNSYTITWKNTNVVNGFSVAIGLQYGHGTGTGGWISGYDYINPAIRPVMDRIREKIRLAVKNP